MKYNRFLDPRSVCMCSHVIARGSTAHVVLPKMKLHIVAIATVAAEAA